MERRRSRGSFLLRSCKKCSILCSGREQERRMREKLTIQDIARLAGVSKATVSRVLNHNPVVSAETNARVMKVVQEHDFVPNVTATGLAGGKTRLVGVLAP